MVLVTNSYDFLPVCLILKSVSVLIVGKNFRLLLQMSYTCLSILLVTSNYRARGTCGPSTLNYSSNGAANA